MVVADVMDRLLVSKYANHLFDGKRFNLKELTTKKLKNSIRLKICNGMQHWQCETMGINKSQEHIKTYTKDSLDYCELKQNK
jgi:hypothetical protein